MMTNTLQKEFSRVYRGGIASYLTEQEALSLYTSVLLHNQNNLKEKDVRAFVLGQLNAFKQLDDKTSILKWLQ